MVKSGCHVTLKLHLVVKWIGGRGGEKEREGRKGEKREREQREREGERERERERWREKFSDYTWTFIVLIHPLHVCDF